MLPSSLSPHRVVVVGGGFGGLAAVRAVLRGQANGRVTVLWGRPAWPLRRSPARAAVVSGAQS